jgi:hypothetical protein
MEVLGTTVGRVGANLNETSGDGLYERRAR